MEFVSSLSDIQTTTLTWLADYYDKEAQKNKEIFVESENFLGIKTSPQS